MIPSQIIGLYTLLKAQIKRTCRLWVQVLVPPIITTALYFMIFGKIMGARIGSIDGISYIEYITPGLIMMAVVNNAFSHVTAVLFGARFQHSIEELLVSPMTNLAILTGYVLGGVIRAFIVGFFVLLVACFFARVQIDHPLLALAVCFIAAVLMALVAFINSVLARTFDDISIIPTFILTPMSYLGGVFYSIHLLPTLWRTISMFNPLLYLINAFRYAFFGVADVAFGTALTVISATALMLAIVCLQMMNKGVGLRQ